MRKYSGGEDKLYINSLCVSGERIKLLKHPKQCYSNKNIKIFAEVDEEIELNRNSNIVTHNDNRKPFKVNVTDYKNLQVCNKQLRQIYETIEIRDFERILHNFQTSDAFKKQAKNNYNDVLRKIDAEDIYEEFFGQYYNYLNDVIKRS
ncbi:hypothetical protein JTB14_009121 [Gonioctena quinquepunctata]|nr:hypothetical protein JTB14_009121 [Gonioctena quinquepunctata]